jgi:hypothetical protein
MKLKALFCFSLVSVLWAQTWPSAPATTSGYPAVSSFLSSATISQSGSAAPTTTCPTNLALYAQTTATPILWFCSGTWQAIPPAATGVPYYSGSVWSTYTVGTNPNNLVQLNGSGFLPAVNASLVTYLPIQFSTTGTSGPATWTPATNALNIPNYAGGGSMTWPSNAGVACYTGSSTWCTSYAVGISANNLVQLNGSGQLPAVSGINLTNLSTTLAGLGGASTYGVVSDASPIVWSLASHTITNGTAILNVHGSHTRALNLTNLVSGGFYTLVIKQDSTGGEALTLGSGCTWKVSGGGAGTITLTGTANSVDILAFTYDGAICWANLQTNFN